MVVPSAPSGLYGHELAEALCRALCLRDFPCQDVERHNKPEIEYATSQELLLPPFVVQGSAPGEACLVEPSINSCRVSFRFGDGDEDRLAATFYRFVGMKAEELPLLRRTAIEGYHVSFLVTWSMLEAHGMIALVTFLVAFATEFPAFVTSLKGQASEHQRQLAAACFDGLQ